MQTNGADSAPPQEAHALPRVPITEYASSGEHVSVISNALLY